jgi:hypothetical protein
MTWATGHGSRQSATGHRYGKHRWSVVLESSTVVEIDCDDVEFTPSGGLIFFGTFAGDTGDDGDAPRRPTIAFAVGQWRYAFATTTFDHRPLAAQYWPGYV